MPIKLTLFILIAFTILGILIGALLGITAHIIRSHRERGNKLPPKALPPIPRPPPPPRQPPQENLEDLLASIHATTDPVELFHLVGRAMALPAAAQQECIRAAHIQFATRIA